MAITKSKSEKYFKSNPILGRGYKISEDGRAVVWRGDFYINEYFQSIGFYVISLLGSAIIMYGLMRAGVVTIKIAFVLSGIFSLLCIVFAFAIYCYQANKNQVNRNESLIVKILCDYESGYKKILFFGGEESCFRSPSIAVYSGVTIKPRGGASTPYRYGHVILTDSDGAFECLCSYLRWESSVLSLFEKFSSNNGFSYSRHAILDLELIDEPTASRFYMRSVFGH
ncbi:MAG: hypothetical protein JKY96_08545 [Phycisphaerales bacterium]|nr:hypothetical protein [Phycisphaerales bacterium]